MKKQFEYGIAYKSFADLIELMCAIEKSEMTAHIIIDLETKIIYFKDEKSKEDIISFLH